MHLKPRSLSLNMCSGKPTRKSFQLLLASLSLLQYLVIFFFVYAVTVIICFVPVWVTKVNK